MLARKIEEVRRDIAFIPEETCEITVISVTPGEGKTSPVARTTNLPTRWLKNPLTIHQRDALKMGRYAQSSVRATWKGDNS